MTERKSEHIIDTALKNIKGDRAVLLNQVVDLNKQMIQSSLVSKHVDHGNILTKYLDALQKSNEQLIKLADIQRKIEETSFDEYSENDNGEIDPEKVYAELEEVEV